MRLGYTRHEAKEERETAGWCKEDEDIYTGAEKPQSPWLNLSGIELSLTGTNCRWSLLAPLIPLAKEVHFQSSPAYYHKMIWEILNESSIKNSWYLR